MALGATERAPVTSERYYNCAALRAFRQGAFVSVAMQSFLGLERRYVETVDRVGPGDPRRFRLISRSLVEHWGMTALADDVELVVSELVSNVLRHAGGPCRVHLSAGPDGFRVQVRDFSPSVLVLVRNSVTEDDSCNGRGLMLARAVSSWLQVLNLPDGKVVTACLAESA